MQDFQQQWPEMDKAVQVAEAPLLTVVAVAGVAKSAGAACEEVLLREFIVSKSSFLQL